MHVSNWNTLNTAFDSMASVVVAPPPVPALDVKEKEQEGDKESSSEKRRYTGLLYVQPDWHKAEQDDTFWVSSHTTGWWPLLTHAHTPLSHSLT